MGPLESTMNELVFVWQDQLHFPEPRSSPLELHRTCASQYSRPAPLDWWHLILEPLRWHRFWGMTENQSNLRRAAQWIQGHMTKIGSIWRFSICRAWCKIDSVKMGAIAKTALDPQWLRAEVLLLNTFSLTNISQNACQHFCLEWLSLPWCHIVDTCFEAEPLCWCRLQENHCNASNDAKVLLVTSKRPDPLKLEWLVHTGWSWGLGWWHITIWRNCKSNIILFCVC